MFIRSISPFFIAGSFLAFNLAAQSAEPRDSHQAITPTVTTTAVVGLVSNQTAKLSVLNLNPVISGPAASGPAACNVQLQFFDVAGNAVGPNRVVTNFAPQTTTVLDADRNTLNPPGVTATIRGQIRGVVTVNPALPVALPVAFPGPGFCTVLVTLEIIDNATQSTVSLTTETRTISPGDANSHAIR